MLTTFPLLSLTPRCPSFHTVKAEANEDLCNIIRDEGRGQLRTVLDHGEILYGIVQCHTGLLHFVPVSKTKDQGQFSYIPRIFILCTHLNILNSFHTHQSEVDTVQYTGRWEELNSSKPHVPMLEKRSQSPTLSSGSRQRSTTWSSWSSDGPHRLLGYTASSAHSTCWREEKSVIKLGTDQKCY